MVNMIVGTNMDRENVSVTLDQTPKQILDEAQIDYSRSAVHLDSCPLSVQGMNTPLVELRIGAGETHTLVCVVKADSAVKLQKCGNSLTLTTSITADMLKNCARLAPYALRLVDENGKESFRVGRSSVGSVSKFGIAFTSVNAEDELFLTMMVEDDAFKTVDEIADCFTAEIDALDVIECQVAEASENIAERVEAAKTFISIL